MKASPRHLANWIFSVAACRLDSLASPRHTREEAVENFQDCLLSFQPDDKLRKHIGDQAAVMILLLVVLGFCLLACSPPCLAIGSIPCLPNPLPKFPPRGCGEALFGCSEWNRTEWSVYLDCYDELVEELDQEHDHDRQGEFLYRYKLSDALAVAAWAGRVNITKAILQRVNKVYDYHGFGQHVELAAGFDHPEVLKLLLDARAKFTDPGPRTQDLRPTRFSKSPLYAAAKGGYVV